jgi:hypothetical protein
MQHERNRSERPGVLVAVYPDAETVGEVRRELEMHGVDPAEIRVGDDRASLLAEMRSEEDRSIGGAAIGGFLTGEQAEGALAVSLVVGAFGLVVGALAGLLVFASLGAWWWRVLAGAAVGGAIFGTVGLVIGGGFGAARADEPSAAQLGVTVEVADTGPEAEHVLVAEHPVRLDEFVDGELVRTIVDHRPSTFRRLGRGLADPSST